MGGDIAGGVFVLYASFLLIFYVISLAGGLCAGSFRIKCCFFAYLLRNFSHFFSLGHTSSSSLRIKCCFLVHLLRNFSRRRGSALVAFVLYASFLLIFYVIKYADKTLHCIALHCIALHCFVSCLIRIL